MTDQSWILILDAQNQNDSTHDWSVVYTALSEYRMIQMSA